MILGSPVVDEVGPVTGRRVQSRWAQFLDIPGQLGFLRKVINDWRGRAWTRETALAIVKRAGVPPKDRLGQAIALGEWTQSHVYYVNEIPETFQSPRRTVELGAGDCDDQTMLMGSMLEALGIPSRVVGLKINGYWQHVFPMAEVARGFGKAPLVVPLDTTLGSPIRQVQNPILLALARGRKVETLTL
jgi:transglutaminase-like putative cysteine protease